MHEHIVLLENEDHLSDRMKRYIADKSKTTTVLYMAYQRDSEQFLEEFSKKEILLFEPTEITWSQYNLLALIMYSLIQENRLSIKEIRILTNRESVEEELRELWEGRTRKYIDVVLQHVKVYEIDSFDYNKKEIHI